MFKRKWIASVWTLRTVDCTCVRTLRISWRGCVAILSMVTATETYRIKEESQWSNLVRVCETDCRKILLRNHLRNTCTQMFERSTVSWLRMRITRGVKCEVLAGLFLFCEGMKVSYLQGVWYPVILVRVCAREFWSSKTLEFGGAPDEL